MLIVGLLLLLTDHRNRVIKDIKDLQKFRSTRTAKLTAAKTALDIDSATRIHERERIDDELRVLMDDTTFSLEEDTFAEETLVKADFRRLKDFYILLMEICNRDEKLLGW